MHTWRSSPDEGADNPWSVWGVRLLAVLCVALAMCLGWGWIEAFYRNVFANSQLSSGGTDLPLPNGQSLHEKFIPIIGNHFFGDFQLPLVYARDLRHSISPYFGRPFPEQYPPFAQVLFIPFTYLPVRDAAVTYLLLSAAIFLVPLWLLLAPLRREYRVIFLVPVAVLTTPFVSFLDRGNDIGIAMGLIVWAIWAWRSERWVWCGAFLAVAIAIKLYPATLLVVPLALRRYRLTVFVAASALLLNLITLANLPGPLLRSMQKALSASSFRTTIHSVAKVSWSVYSVIPNTAGLLFGRSAGDSLLVPKGLIDWLPGVVYLCGVYLVIRRGRVPQWCWGPLSLASIQLCVPLSFSYTTAWAPVAAVWFAWGYFIHGSGDAFASRDGQRWLTLRILVFSALVVTLTPSVFTVSASGRYTTPVARYLSPLLLLVTLCAAIVYSFRPNTQSVTDVPIEATEDVQDKAAVSLEPTP